jgi:hypothetical protein
LFQVLDLKRCVVAASREKKALDLNPNLNQTLSELIRVQRLKLLVSRDGSTTQQKPIPHAQHPTRAQGFQIPGLKVQKRCVVAA